MGGEHPQILLSARARKGEVRGAVLVLSGARQAELRRACALAALLADRCLLIAVDGGLRACRAGKRRPDLYVGDGDSVARLPRDIPTVVYDREKEFNDLSGALSEARRRGVEVVTVAGLLGGRLDHEWANLAELGAAARWFGGILATTTRGLVLVTARGCRAATVRGRPFSVMALGAAATASLRGARWGLSRRRLRPGSLGLSNVTGTSLHLVVHSGVVAVVFPPSER